MILSQGTWPCGRPGPWLGAFEGQPTDVSLLLYFPPSPLSRIDRIKKIKKYLQSQQSIKLPQMRKQNITNTAEAVHRAPSSRLCIPFSTKVHHFDFNCHIISTSKLFINEIKQRILLCVWLFLNIIYVLAHSCLFTLSNIIAPYEYITVLFMLLLMDF